MIGVSAELLRGAGAGTCQAGAEEGTNETAGEAEDPCGEGAAAHARVSASSRMSTYCAAKHFYTMEPCVGCACVAGMDCTDSAVGKVGVLMFHFWVMRIQHGKIAISNCSAFF